MDRKVVSVVAGISLAAVALAVLLPGGRAPDSDPLLPWEVSRNADGQTRVFGITLGDSTLHEAERLFEAQAKLSLFRSPENDYAIEAYFQRLNLSGLRGDFILSLALPRDQAEAVFERGLRISRLGSGTQKVELSPEDAQALKHTTVTNLTYIPSANLDESLLRARFGEPEKQAEEPSGVVHWLYPHKGLDIAVNPEGKEVLQYFNGEDLERIARPLSPLPEGDR
ncbi:hypothetical protein [Motiliproteus sp. SC1-56]|uniref:hypothetical protein n=1 Tax=Motiliproteus sp. SC1-56 TaxID=2799565 RepID=UPI001A8F27F7|nr:hypothetical protein [Motiliproteus sp. SC1-56]